MQAVDAGLPGAGRRLVRRDDQLAQPELAVQRAERHDHRQRRAVGVGDDPLAAGRGACSALTSGTTSGTSGSIRNAPELSTTTAPRAAAIGAHCARDLVGHVEHRHVDAVEDLRAPAPATVSSSPRTRSTCPADRARRSAGSRPRRSRARTSMSQHHGADGAGGADDGERRRRSAVGALTARSRRTRRPRSSPPSSNASCTARTAASRSVSRQTTEIRISEVEIISMLTPAVAERGEERRRHAGVRAHARADQRDLADVVVVEQVSSKPTSACTCSSAAIAGRPVGLGQRERDVGAARSPLGRDVLHDHVDVDLGLGDRREDPRRLARLVRHADDGDLGLAPVVRDAGDDRLFHGKLLHRSGDHRARRCRVRRADVDRDAGSGGAYSTQRRCSTFAPQAASSSISS